jgi:aminocarboxymuconate-semialdehyde decarboxylase
MSGHRSGRVLDLHAHAVLEAGFNQAGRHGPATGVDDGVPFFRIGNYRMKPMSYRGTVFMDVEKRLDLMAQLGIDLQLLSPNPLTMFHRIEADLAAHFCRVHNDAMAELVAKHPGKFLGAAALPMQDVDAAMRELERAVKELGLVAAHTGTRYPFPLDDPRLDDFYRTLVELDVPLFLHPESTGGAEGPDDARLGRFDFTILLGYAYEETLAVATLVLGGVLDRHPDVDICVSHGGGAMPYLIDHFERMGKLRNWEALHGGTFRAAMNRLWFDAHTEGDAAHDMLVATLGTERLVYGTNFGGWDTPRHVDDFAASLTPNAERLLRLAPGGTARVRG